MAETKTPDETPPPNNTDDADDRSSNSSPEASTDERPPRFGESGPAMDRRNPFYIGFVGAIGVLVAYAVFMGIRNATSILVLIFVAMFLAIGLNPAVTRITRWGVPRGGAVAIVTLVGLAVLAGGLYALVPPLVTQTGQLINNIPDYIQRLQRNETINDLVQRYDVVDKVRGAVSASTVGNTLGGVVGVAGRIFGTIFNVLTVLVLTIYFMAAFERIKKGAYRLVPATRRERVRLLTDEILTKVGAYMVGALMIALLAGLSTWMLVLILGLAYPFALAVVVAVLDLIPQIGATLGAVVVSLVGLAHSLTAGLVCVGFFLVYQQVENYLIYPNVMRRSVAVSDVAAVVAALLGAALFGVIGALAAIPIVAAIQLIGREVVIPAAERR
ncbi:AI-2E family transporter [Actinoplanes sp. NPDC051633]|uniref:AI-2E family transporter n=1 Tax=Actinoplanes sp. NPDC051633 TaxID=3155670 RepID=UPI0034131F6B